MNVQRTPERLQKRANRLWIWAIITQPVFSLAFLHHQPWWALNILFVFAGVTQLLALQYRHGRKGFRICDNPFKQISDSTTPATAIRFTPGMPLPDKVAILMASVIPASP